MKFLLKWMENPISLKLFDAVWKGVLIGIFVNACLELHFIKTDVEEIKVLLETIKK